MDGFNNLFNFSLIFIILSVTVAFANTNKENNSPKKIESKKVFVGKSSPVTNPEDYVNSSDVLPGVIIVKFKNNVNLNSGITRTDIPSLDEKILRHQVYSIEKVFPFLENSLLRHASQLQRIFYFRFNSEVNPGKIAAEFSKDPNIEYAEPKHIFKSLDDPNDPQYSSMDQFNQIQASAAWTIIKGDSGDVIIAIADGGTDWNHQDLLGNVWTNPGEIPNNSIDDDNNGFIDDVHGWNFANNSNDPTGLPNTPGSASHGTHVAGTAAAVTNNDTGVASLSWNCTFMPVNIADPGQDGIYSFSFDGVAYAAANGADIINCSWGRNGPPSSFEQDVINLAYNNGSLVVAAAGNGGGDNVGDNNDITPHYPSSYNHVLAVGATFRTFDTKATFSNYGKTVDVFAPGVQILSTTPNNGYQQSGWSGTSMASPHVAGLAGLVKTQHPNWSVEQVMQQVRVTCDKIDAVNASSVQGLLGKGRINAFRAVSDSTIPAIRILQTELTDTQGDSIIDAGDTANVAVTFKNYLGDASDISITLSTDDEGILINNGNGVIATLNSNETAVVNFQFVVSIDITQEMVTFLADITSGTYTDYDFLHVEIRPQLFTHDTGPVQTSVTVEGNIGFTGFAGETAGVGFVLNGENYLFEGGLMIGTAVANISDCIRGTDQSTQDNDFRPTAGEVLALLSPGQLTNEQTTVLLVDSSAISPIGISVLQETYADTASDLNKFVIFKYTITNLNSTQISNLYAGLFFDWDWEIAPQNFNNSARFDQIRGMGYAQDVATNPTRLAATKLLTTSSSVSYRAINNVDELYDGFTLLEKWDFLSGGIQTQTLDNVDISTLLSEGPISIPASGSVVVGFAVIGANSLTELETNADNAQNFWDNNFVTGIDITDNSIPARFQLKQNYPNPFNPSTTIEYSIHKAGLVKIAIYNLLGEKVRSLVNTLQEPNVYRVTWDGENDAGYRVASGVYIYKLSAGDFTDSRKMILMK